MPWAIRFLDSPLLHDPRADSRHYDGTVDFEKLSIGELCYYHYQGKPCMDRAVLDRLNLTAYYFAHNIARAPLILAMPDAASPGRPRYFMVDGQCYSRKCTRCGKICWGDKPESKCQCPGESTPRGYYDGWTVSGAPPVITVSPSINFDDEEGGIKHYHGFVQNGVIGDG